MHKCAQLDFSTILRLLLSRQRVCMNFTPCLLKIQITILFCAEFFTQSKIRNTKYMRFSWGNCIILLLCYRTCQKHTKSFKTEKSRRNSPIMQYYSYHLITSCSQNLIFNIFCYLIMQLRANIHFSVTVSAFSPFRHCEGIYARGNPLHGTSITLSLRGHLCPRQSPAWSKHYTVIARAFMPAAIPCMEQVLHCHCEGVHARGNPLHGTSTATTPSS